MKLHLHLNLRKLNIAGLTAMVCMTPPFAQAQMADAGYGYGGLSVGRSQGKFGTEAQVAAGLSAGASLTGFTRDSNDTGFKIFGGYKLHRNVAIEAGYFDLGKPGYSATSSPAGTTEARFKLNGANLDLVGTLPLSTNLSALGRVGLAAGRSRATFVNTGSLSLADTSKRNTNGKFGLGLQYALGTTTLVRGEVERYRMNDAVGGHVNVNLVSVGLVFPFGVTAPTRPVAMMPMPVMAPAPMVRAPEPVPVPAPIVVVQAAPEPMVVAPAPRRRVTFSAESLFGFDRFEVNPEGKSALDKFARELDGTDFEMVVVEGHTDRLGTTAYNDHLSLQRAEAVKNYLVTSGHINPAKISAAGKGESSPTTKPGECSGTQASAQLIICLRPDRRVDVDVVGTR
jgi:OmpA-OmpF porin, OOP family